MEEDKDLISKTQEVIHDRVEQLESLGEAIANATTHGLGALLSIAALILLVVFASMQDNAVKIVSAALYGSSLVILYSSSTLYHSLSHPPLKRYLRIMDHSAIFLLIAGTYTPFALVTLNGAWGWTLFFICWGLALFGITFKLIFKHRYDGVSLAIYLLMGWIGLIAAKPLYNALSAGAIIWIVIGGLAYTGGTVFYAWKRLPFAHTIWHMFVLIGSTCHFFAVFFYVIL